MTSVLAVTELLFVPRVVGRLEVGLIARSADSFKVSIGLLKRGALDAGAKA